MVKKGGKKVIEEVAELIKKRYARCAGIVYCLSKKDTETTAEALRVSPFSFFLFSLSKAIVLWCSRGVCVRARARVPGYFSCTSAAEAWSGRRLLPRGPHGPGGRAVPLDEGRAAGDLCNHRLRHGCAPPTSLYGPPLPPPNSPDDAAETHCPADGNDLPEVFTTFAPNPPSGATSIIRHQRDCLLCFRGSLQ